MSTRFAIKLPLRPNHGGRHNNDQNVLFIIGRVPMPVNIKSDVMDVIVRTSPAQRLSAPLLVEDFDPTRLPLMVQLVHCRRDHQVGKGLHRNAQLIGPLNQRTNCVSVPQARARSAVVAFVTLLSKVTANQLRESFRIEAALRLGDELKLA